MLKKLTLALIIAFVVMIYFISDGGDYFSLAFFRHLYSQSPFASAGIFFLVYFLAAAFSLPAAALLTVIAGLIFGLLTGTLLVSFASSLGATVACFFSRFLLRNWVQRKLGDYLENINEGLKRDGAVYLFTLRLIPVFPFWVLNLAFGVTRLPLGKFYLVSQLGMLPGTLVYVNAGARLGTVEELSLQGILTPGLIGALVLLALFPYLARKIVSCWQEHRRYKPWKKPSRFDANLVVVGAGSGGLVTAYLASALKAKVVLVEKHLMGGDCLNTGCVPSKALLRAARAAQDIRRAADLGVVAGRVDIDFSAVMRHVHGAVNRIAPHDSIERYTGLGVNCLTGIACLRSPWAVEVDGKIVTAKSIVIATGARPRIPDIPGLASLDFLTSENIWSITSLPKRLLVLGGGPVGCEMAQAFQRLGSQVTLVQRRAQLLAKADSEAAELLAGILVSEGVAVLTSSQVAEFRHADGQDFAVVVSGGQRQEIGFDRVLVALGRKASTSEMGLDSLGIKCRNDGSIKVNEFQQTSFPNIFACGDVCGPYQFTHASSHQAWYAAVNGLFGKFWKFKVDNRLMPSVVYTDPEVAQVGLTEKEASELGKEFEVTQYPLSQLDRAITDCATAGFVKIITHRGTDRILGVTIVGDHAGEMLMGFVAAMKYRKGLNSVLSTIHPYPVFSEANKLAAGQWKRNHTPVKLLDWVAKYHRWQLTR